MKKWAVLSLAVFFLAALLLAGCDSAKRVPETGQQAEEVAPLGGEGGLSALPCFKCHSRQAFTSGFPHDLHQSMGLHCTECHILKTHREMSINRKVCGSCHAAGAL